jgi:hypothetical protein
MICVKAPLPDSNHHNPQNTYPYVGVILTSVFEKPPYPARQRHMNRWFKGKKDLRTLRVHLAQARNPRYWIENAVERLTQYAKEQKCKHLFVMANVQWRFLAPKFWGPYWDTVAFSRDRVTKHWRHQKPCKRNNGCFSTTNRVGYYRLLQPVHKMSYASREYLRFEL